MTSYAIALAVCVLAAALGWAAMRREGPRDLAQFAYLRKPYVIFLLFLAGLVALLLVGMGGRPPAAVYQRLGLGLLTVVGLLLAVPICVASVRLEPRMRRVLARRIAMLLSSLALPGLVYWSLVGSVDILFVTIAVLIGAILALSLLVWDLYGQGKGGR